ncbi:MAG: NAD(P)H-dependent oxidoreductase [Desulfobulbaceae bacterium]|jgi:multimeric flavodoxin WrbA|nr:NAD(P)H-dependent oxidoreductase [Desulfobulbaceae bacterium]
MAVDADLTRKNILIIYHSQGGVMEKMAQRFAAGARREEAARIVFRKAAEASIDDLLCCDAIAIGSPEYFGTMAGMIKDFFDRTYLIARDRTIGLPYALFVCAGNDGRGAITQIERLAIGYKWRKVLAYERIVGEPTEYGFAQKMRLIFSSFLL